VVEKMSQKKTQKKVMQLLRLKLWGRNLSIYITVAYTTPQLTIQQQLQIYCKESIKKVLTATKRKGEQ
jgi:hypothetical protein